MGHHGVVPRLAGERLEARNLAEPIWSRRDEYHLPGLAQNQKHVHVGKEHELPAVTLSLPATLSRLEVETGESVPIETIAKAFM